MGRFNNDNSNLMESEDEKKFKFSLKNLDKESTIKIALVGITLLVTVGTYQFLVIPKVSENVRQATIAEVDVNAMPKTLVPVMNPDKKIEKYSLLTEQMINDNFTLTEVPINFAINNAVPDLSMMVDKVTTVDLIPNSQVSTDFLTDQSDWFGDFDRLKEYEIGNTVGGKAAIGNLVDIVVDYGNGDYDVVASYKKITNIKPEGAASPVQTNPDGTTSQLLGEVNDMVFSVDELEYANLKAAKELGDLEIRIYIDEGQEPSEVTFNPSNTTKIKAQQKTAAGNTATAGTGQ